jgi:Zn-dependent protease with chaperone function
MSSYVPHVGPAVAGAALYGITLDEQQALSWAKELAADVNAFLIIVTDSLKAGLRDEVKESWYRALIAGISLALKAWDLMLEESCYGNAYLSRGLLRTHPPARWRIEYLGRSSQAAQTLGVMSGDRLWADRVMDALDDLHQRKGAKHG